MESHSARRTCRIPLWSRNNFHGWFSSVLPHSSGVQDSARQQTQLVEHSMAWQCSPVGPWSWLLKEVVAPDKNHCRAGCQSSSLKLTYSLNRALHSPSTISRRRVPYACILCKAVWPAWPQRIQQGFPIRFLSLFFPCATFWNNILQVHIRGTRNFILQHP